MPQEYLRNMLGFQHQTGQPGRARLLHFVSTFELKTDTKWLLQFTRHLNRDDFELSVCCFYHGGPVQAQLEKMGVATHNLDLPSERDPRAILRARRVIDKVAPDVV